MLPRKSICVRVYIYIYIYMYMYIYIYIYTHNIDWGLRFQVSGSGVRGFGVWGLGISGKLLQPWTQVEAYFWFFRAIAQGLGFRV